MLPKITSLRIQLKKGKLVDYYVFCFSKANKTCYFFVNFE